jgi:hypothetical protein
MAKSATSRAPAARRVPNFTFTLGKEATLAKTRRAPKTAGTITVAAHRVGASAQTGEILEVLGESDRKHYRVRWEDGKESIVYPSSDAVIELRSGG